MFVAHVKDALRGRDKEMAATDHGKPVVLYDARATPRKRQVALLQFANPVQRALRSELPTRTIRRHSLGILHRRGRRRVPPEGADGDKSFVKSTSGSTERNVGRSG